MFQILRLQVKIIHIIHAIQCFHSGKHFLKGQRISEILVTVYVVDDIFHPCLDLLPAVGKLTLYIDRKLHGYPYIHRRHDLKTCGDQPFLRKRIADGIHILPGKLRELFIRSGKHCDMDKVIIDEAAHTVYLEDPDMSLDVGATAKGYATELVAHELISRGFDCFLISAGSNIIRFVPPLIIGKADIDRMYEIITKVLQKL